MISKELYLKKRNWFGKKALRKHKRELFIKKNTKKGARSIQMQGM